MGKITERLVERAFTDGTLENLLGGVENYIKQVSSSPLSENDQRLFMLHLLALIETASEKEKREIKEIRSKLVYEIVTIRHSVSTSYPEISFRNLLPAIQEIIDETEDSSLSKKQQDKLLAYIETVLTKITITAPEKIQKVLQEYLEFIGEFSTVGC